MREYKYDNLKFIMIFCTIFAHCLQLIEGKVSNQLYFFIYTFHMPIFVFISGYFAKCTKKRIIKYGILYFIWQTIYCIFDKFVFGLNIKIEYTIPNWILWYMFALLVWTILLKIFDTKNKKKCLFFICLTFILSVIVGFFDKIGYKFSLARIITFLPYFLLGYYVRNVGFDFIKIRRNGLINKKLIIILVITLIITTTYFLGIKNNMKREWLFGSHSYNVARYTFIFKFMWILLSMCELILFDNFITNKKLPLVSTIGANTLYIYLLHGLVLKFFRYKKNIFVYTEFQNIIIAIIVTILMLIIFGNVFKNRKIEKKEQVLTN